MQNIRDLHRELAEGKKERKLLFEREHDQVLAVKKPASRHYLSSCVCATIDY